MFSILAEKFLQRWSPKSEPQAGSFFGDTIHNYVLRSQKRTRLAGHSLETIFVIFFPPKSKTLSIDFCVMLVSEIHAAWSPAARHLGTPAARHLGAQAVPGSGSWRRFLEVVPGSGSLKWFLEAVPGGGSWQRFLEAVPGMLQNVLECFGMLQNASECSGMHQNAPGCCRMLQNAPECTRMLQNALECSRML